MFIIHPLNFGELLFVDFLRTFFSQDILITGAQNNFIYPDFPIDIENVYNINHENIIPAITVQLSGNGLQEWTIDMLSNMDWGNTTHEHMDSIQTNLSIHSMSSERAESLLLASLVFMALLNGRLELKEQGLHKMMPPTISPPELQAGQGESRPKRWVTTMNVIAFTPLFWGVREVGPTLRDCVMELFTNQREPELYCSCNAVICDEDEKYCANRAIIE